MTTHLLVQLDRIGPDGAQIRAVFQSVVDLVEAARVVRATLERDGLGVSALLDGFGDVWEEVRRDSSRVGPPVYRSKVAHITYNGRVWSPHGALLMEAPPVVMSAEEATTAVHRLMAHLQANGERMMRENAALRAKLTAIEKLAKEGLA